MRARDELYPLQAPRPRVGECYIVDGDDGLAGTVENHGEIMLADMRPGPDRTDSAEAVRRTFVEQGFREDER